MIDFIKSENKLLFRYIQEYPIQGNWVKEAMEAKRKIVFKKTFSFIPDDYIKDPKDIAINEINDPATGNQLSPDFKEDATETEGITADNIEDIDPTEVSFFEFGYLDGDYYKIKRGILINSFDVFISKEILPEVNHFVVDNDISVFKIIKEISDESIFIGGNEPSAVPFEDFEKLIIEFPGHYEKKLYTEARVSSILRNYLNHVKDAEKKYNRYLNKKISKSGKSLITIFKDSELLKYRTMYDRLREMLADEKQYNEHHWQKEILQIILLLYPKYILVFQEVPIRTKIAGNIKERYLDFLLVDSGGNIDIIEIKKPFDNAVMTKGVYRDNYIPLRELSGTVMQIEKYIYYLNRWSYNGEIFLTEKYKNELPEGLDLKITNPNGIIIMGRDNNLSEEQRKDFEVVKRKYKNIMDIITYDDLLQRLKLTIDHIKDL